MINHMSVSRTSSSELRCNRRGLPDVSAGLCRVVWFGVVFLLGPAPTVAADDAKATIAGGVRSGNTQFYDWNVTNLHTSPIVYIEFPQYHGDTFTAPSGWSKDWKNQMKLGGGRDAPGWVRTSVENPAAGIQTGRSAAFAMRIARAGALARSGRVTVRFADGVETVVSDVELPCAPGFTEQRVTLFALVVIFVIALTIHFRRRHKASTSSTPTASTVSDEP